MSQKEPEIVIYAKIGDYEGLKQAQQTVYQEQAQIRAPNGRIRVRMEKPQGATQWDYTLTTKKNMVSGQALQDCDEDNEPTDARAYEMFKSVCDVFQRKIRYVFAVENISVASPGMDAKLEVPQLNYEVDVFITKNQTMSKWCKIDVEIAPLMQALQAAGLNKAFDLKLKVSSLPFKPTAAFMADPANPKTKELISAIFDNEFNRPIEQEQVQMAMESLRPMSQLHRDIGRKLLAAF